MVNKIILQLLHIETLFMIGVAITFVYLTLKNKNPLEEFEKMARKIAYPKKSNKIKLQRKINKNEEKCREIFEHIYGVPFKSVRPDWLKNPTTGRNLELDGFNPTIRTYMGRGLAFEYDGAQHSKYVPRFHPGGLQEFQYQMKKDSWKDLMCEKYGVLLIRIPDFVAYDDLERFIKSKLSKLKIYGPV